MYSTVAANMDRIGIPAACSSSMNAWADTQGMTTKSAPAACSARMPAVMAGTGDSPPATMAAVRSGTLGLESMTTRRCS